MRTLTFDPYEFDPPDAEEELEISIVTKRDRPFPTVAAFAAAVLDRDAARTLPPPVSFQDCNRARKVREYLERYAGVTLPTPCEWPTYVVSDKWDDWDALLVGPETLIRYHWSTTA